MRYNTSKTRRIWVWKCGVGKVERKDNNLRDWLIRILSTWCNLLFPKVSRIPPLDKLVRKILYSLETGLCRKTHRSCHHPFSGINPPLPCDFRRYQSYIFSWTQHIWLRRVVLDPLRTEPECGWIMYFGILRITTKRQSSEIRPAVELTSIDRSSSRRSSNWHSGPSKNMFESVQTLVIISTLTLR